MFEIKDFQMYTDEGNFVVGRLVRTALDNCLTWAEVYNQLYELSKDERYGEATDTAVREVVYWAIGAEKREESFWV